MKQLKPDRDDLIVDLEELVLPVGDNGSSVMSYVISVQNIRTHPIQRIEYEFEVGEDEIQTSDPPMYYVWVDPQQQQSAIHGWQETEHASFDWDWEIDALKIAAVFAMQVFTATHNNIAHFLLLNLHVCSKRSLLSQRMFADAAKRISLSSAHLTDYGYGVAESENVLTDAIDLYAKFFSISMCRGMSNEDFKKAFEQGSKMMEDLQKATRSGLDQTIVHEMKRDPSLN